MELAGAVVVVTGASSGIGAATAAAAARAGARVALLARRQDAIETIAAGLPDAIAVRCDVTDQADVDAAVQAVLNRWGRIDVLVNNAGQTLNAPIEAIDLDDFRAIVELNLISPLRMTQAVLPAMRSRGAGAIVDVSSGITLQPYPASGAYAATKAGLNQLNAVARAELADSGVAVSRVLPSLTRTGLYKAARGPQQDESGMDDAQTPAQVADVILQLIESGDEAADLVPIEYGGTYTSDTSASDG